MRGQKRRAFRSTGRQHGTRRQILPAAVAMTVGLMTPLALILPPPRPPGRTPSSRA
ncbi:Serine hydrolase OS=Streptomyces microflavus OX=1919 GN=Smic_41330 PE=4 SV=1 [Streptomyces microflavus]